MNNKVIINPDVLFNYNFNCYMTYRLLYYVMVNYDQSIHKVKLDVAEINKQIGVSKPTLYKGIRELLEYNIIIKCEYYKNWYKINKKKLYGR